MSSLFRYQLFDGFHIMYIVISLLLTGGILYLASKYLKKESHKEAFLKFWGLITFLLHISPLWLDFLRNGQASVADNMLFPIFFCNLSMFLLMITSFISNKKTIGFRYFATVTAYAGSFGALISLFYPQYYLEGSRMTWGIMKSMLSHSTMLVGCAYLMIGKYFKIERKNTIIYTIGLLGFGFIGILVNLTFKLAGLYDPATGYPNAMFLLRPPIEDVKFLNFFVISIGMILLVYIFSYLMEKISKKFQLTVIPVYLEETRQI